MIERLMMKAGVLEEGGGLIRIDDGSLSERV